MALTFPVPPMKAAIGTLPPDDERWAYEIKWDGYRTLAFVEGGRVRLQSTKGLDVTANYPELAGIHEGVHADVAILDAELVVLGEDGKPRFALVQQHTRQAALMLFDVLRVDDHDTIGLPYEDRRRLLDQLVEPGDNWAVPSYQIGDGASLLAVTLEQDLEGVMAKRLGSVYVPGKRSPNWRKVKNRRRTDVVIGGFTEGGGNRTSTFGSLLVGRYDGDALVFAGGVGTGFNQKLLTGLTKRLRSMATRECPFDPLPPAAYRKGATWVRPELGAEIEMTEFTNDGLVRHASFIRLIEPGSDA
jgi:bifunctional non-homologous end joining protein LigD